jgi:dihydroxyacetone kinase
VQSSGGDFFKLVVLHQRLHRLGKRVAFIWRQVAEEVRAAGITVVRHLTGSYVTSLEMAGCSITVTAVTAELLALWDAPVHTAALRWGM